MNLYIIFLLLLVRLMPGILSNINLKAFRLKLFNRRMRNINSMFENNFIDTQVLFATRFKALANISLVRPIDASKAYELVLEKFKNEITQVYQYNTFDYDKNASLFNVTIFVLKNKRIIEVGQGYAGILYTGLDRNWASGLLSELADFRVTYRIKVMGFVNSEVMNEN